MEVINDFDDISSYIQNKKENENIVIFFYKFFVNYQSESERERDHIRVNIEYHQNNIDRILLDLNKNCQVYLIKYLIYKKLNRELPIGEMSLILQSLGLTIVDEVNRDKKKGSRKINFNEIEAGEENINYEAKNKISNNNLKNMVKISTIKELKENLTIEEVICYWTNSTSSLYSTNNKDSGNSNRINLSTEIPNVLNLLLIRKGNKKCSIGLDFSFTLMKELKS
jgi:hypothetical protein